MYSGFCTYMFVLSVFYFVLHCEQPRCSPHYLSTFRTNYVAMKVVHGVINMPSTVSVMFP